MTVPIATLEAELAGLKAEKAHYQAQCETAESELNIWRSSILQTNKIATTRKEELRVENADRMFMIRELKREYSDLSFRLQQRGQSTVFELPPAPLRGTSHDIQVKNEAPVAGPSTSRTQPSRPFLLPSIVPSTGVSSAVSDSDCPNSRHTDIIDLTDDSGELERVTLQPAVPSRNTKRKGLNSQPPEFLSTQEGPKPGKEEVKVKPKVASPLVETKKPVSQHTHVLPDTKPPQQVKRSFGSLSAYYQDTEKFKIQPTPDPHFTISRIELSSLYGGNPMTLVHCIKAARNPVDSCDRELVFPQPGLNTSIPSQPGYPGAMFSSTLEASRLDIKSLFSKYRGAQWTYLGEYTFTVCGKVPADIFAGLNQKVCSAGPSKCDARLRIAGVEQKQVGKADTGCQAGGVPPPSRPRCTALAENNL